MNDINTATESTDTTMTNEVTTVCVPASKPTIPAPRVRGATKEAPATTTTSEVDEVVAPPVSSTSEGAIRVLKHSEAQESRREFIKNRVGEGTILHLTRSDSENAERTVLCQVTKVTPVRGRYGYTELEVQEFGTTQTQTFNWRDNGIRSMQIANLNEISAIIGKVEAEKIKAEAMIEFRKAENARKSAARTAKKGQSAPPVAE